MSNDKKQKGNWGLLIVGVFLVSVITVGAFWISPLDFNKTKNSVINIVENLNWETGFFASTTIEETRQKKDKTGSFTETIVYESGKTLWDWLDLAGTLAVPILIFYVGYLFERKNKREEDQRDKERQQQAELENQIAKDNLSEEAIQGYLNYMAQLLLDRELRKQLFPNVNDKLKPSTYDNPVRDVVRIQTTTILRRLEGDSDRQTRIIYFLRDAELYEFILKYANLSGANLSGVNLSGADLREANLREANLFLADLREADLREADLREANLSGVELREANLFSADLSGANLREANLFSANLIVANLREAENLTNKQIKSACFWENAIFYLNEEEKQKAKIKELQEDRASDPKEKPNSDKWK